MIDYNSYFNLDYAIRAGEITREEIDRLIEDGRVFVTTLYMDRQKAYEVMGGDRMDFDEEEVLYGGHIVVSPGGGFEEAQEIANKRRLGETIGGKLFFADESAAASPVCKPRSEKETAVIVSGQFYYHETEGLSFTTHANNNADWQKVEKGLYALRDEINRQLKNKKLCPFNPEN